MERNRLKRKATLLAWMLLVLIFLMLREEREEEPDRNPEEAQRLIIPEAEEEAQAERETFTMPGADEPIRVLLLAEDGSIYHADRELSRTYPGELQYYEEDDGWVIVNEVALEDYLCRVVPSEMPSGYAEEALKAQAVCARTYAVWQMQEYAYPEYEAHVDDSVSYQVYNSIENQESTDAAVAATSGEILLYEDRPVKAYYFATSCGLTTDENIWEDGDSSRTPYIAGRRVGDSTTVRDYTDEETFAAFIRKKHAGDLEIAEPWYRWNCYVSLEQIRKNLDADLGEVLEAEITARNTGGAVQKLCLTGTKETVEIEYEYRIREALGIPRGQILKNDGTIYEGGALLPSGYFVLEPVTENGTLTGYQIYGGGLGHGAGMSQNGARILAEQGWDYEEILGYFYQDVRLARLE